MLKFVVSILLLFAGLNAFADDPPASTDVREGLEFPASTLREFKDEQILSAIQQSIVKAEITPIWRIDLAAYSDTLEVRVVGAVDVDRFACTVTNGETSCAVSDKDSFALTEHQVSIPYGNLLPYGFEPYRVDGNLAFTGGVVVALITVYAGKKLFNKLVRGNWRVRQKRVEDLDPLFALAAEGMFRDLTAEGWRLAKTAECQRRPTDALCQIEGRESLQRKLVFFFPRLVGGLVRDVAYEFTRPAMSVIEKGWTMLEIRKLDSLSDLENKGFALFQMAKLVRQLSPESMDARLDKLEKQLATHMNSGLHDDARLKLWIDRLYKVYEESRALSCSARAS